MTIREFIKKHGWNSETVVKKTDKVMSVAVVFESDVSGLDETEFDINAYDCLELNELYTDFCRENKCAVNTVVNVIIKKSAASMDYLYKYDI